MPCLLAACVVVPRTTTSYDTDCQVLTRHMELEARQIAPLQTCRDTAECTGILAGSVMGVVASAVVSGSIAIAGNIVYWLEKQGQCVKAG